MVIFGTKKLRNIGADLGGAVKGFKDGMKQNEEKAAEAATQQVTANTAAPAPTANKDAIDVEAKPKL